MAVCTCKENGRRYDDVQWDTRGCPLHCDHSHINVWAAEWYCDCGSAWNRHRMIITADIALMIGHPELSGEVGYTHLGDLYVGGKMIRWMDDAAEQNNTRRRRAQETT